MKTIYLLLLIISMLTCLYGQKKQSAKKNVKTKNLISKTVYSKAKISKTISSKSIIPKSSNQSESVKINRVNPAVYIDFVRVGDGEPRFVGESDERVYLRLINNSIWSVYVHKFTYGKDVKNTGLYYDVERQRVRKIMFRPIDEVEVPLGYKRENLSSENTEIKSGDSIDFSVPKEHLSHNLKIRVDLKFDWQLDLDNPEQTSSPTNPSIRNSIYFTNSQLKEFLETNISKLRSQ